MNMLSRLVDMVFPPRESELLVRSVGELAHYLDPRVCELGCDVTALLRYDIPAVRASIIETKFHANEKAARILGNVLAAYITEELDDMRFYEDCSYVLVPIPLSQERLQGRGYNQVEMIARHTSAPVDTRLLVRVRDTLPQTMLDGRARRKNLEGAFGVTRTPAPSVTYFVLDDVVTTGTTISEAVRCLYNVGAWNVRAVVLAH